MASRDFRDFVPPKDHPKVTGLENVDSRQWGARAETHPVIGPVLKDWLELAKQPFHGITADGSLIPELYKHENLDAPVHIMVQEAEILLAQLTTDQRSKLSYSFDAREKRRWSNPELLIFDNGLRIEDLNEDLRSHVYKVMEASLSPKGYTKAVNCMRVNHFLGQICHCQGIMNQHSYNFLIFGTPSLTDEWGWMLYGHHLCLNIYVRGSYMSIAPTFMGAEPNLIDEGPWKGTRVFGQEERYGLKLMQSLKPEFQKKAQLYKSMTDPAFPPGRLHRGDERHLAGAFQDNRVIPYEGVSARTFTESQKDDLLKAVEGFLEYLPAGPLSHRLNEVKSYMDDTWFCWIGGFGDDDPFYYRIQSPVVLVEFDHHSAVWLLNEYPEKFHTHTVARMPNGGDYGHVISDI